MLLLGLTGSIATGKSTVSSILTSPPYNIPIIDADKVARQVVEPGTSGYKQIVDYFGPSTPDLLLPATPENGGENGPNGKGRALNRPALGRRVFGQGTETDRKALNRITHPAVRKEMYKQMLYAYLAGHWCVVLDVPLLFESGWEPLCGTIMVVAVKDAEVQKARLMSRDAHLTEEDASNRIASQLDVREKARKALARGERAGVVVWNDGSKEDLKKQIEAAMVNIKKGSPQWWAYLLLICPFFAVFSGAWSFARSLYIKKRLANEEQAKAKFAIDDRCETVRAPSPIRTPSDKYNGPRDGPWHVRENESYIDDRCATVFDYTPIIRGYDDQPVCTGLVKKLAQDVAMRRVPKAQVEEKDVVVAEPKQRESAKPRPFIIPKMSQAKRAERHIAPEKMFSLEEMAETLRKDALVAAKRKSASPQVRAGPPPGAKHGIRIVGTDGEEAFVEMSSEALAFINKAASDAAVKDKDMRGSKSVHKSRKPSKRGEQQTFQEANVAEISPVEQIDISTPVERLSSPAMVSETHTPRRSSRGQSTPRRSARMSSKHSQDLDEADEEIVSHLWEVAEHVYVTKHGKPAQSIEQDMQEEKRTEPGPESFHLEIPGSIRHGSARSATRSLSQSHQRHKTKTVSVARKLSKERASHQPDEVPLDRFMSGALPEPATPSRSTKSRTLNAESPRSMRFVYTPAAGGTRRSDHESRGQTPTRCQSQHISPKQRSWQNPERTRGDLHNPVAFSTHSAVAETALKGPIELPPSFRGTASTHSSFKSIDELRLDAQQTLQAYREEETHSLQAGRGWLSPHPLSLSPIGRRTSAASHITIPGYEGEGIKKMTYEEFRTLQSVYEEADNAARQSPREDNQDGSLSNGIDGVGIPADRLDMVATASDEERIHTIFSSANTQASQSSARRASSQVQLTMPWD